MQSRMTRRRLIKATGLATLGSLGASHLYAADRCAPCPSVCPSWPAPYFCMEVCEGSFRIGLRHYRPGRRYQIHASYRLIRHADLPGKCLYELTLPRAFCGTKLHLMQEDPRHPGWGLNTVSIVARGTCGIAKLVSYSKTYGTCPSPEAKSVHPVADCIFCEDEVPVEYGDCIVCPGEKQPRCCLTVRAQEKQPEKAE